MVNIGERIPDFELPNRHGDLVRLSGFLGDHSLVLFFYPKAFTAGCIMENCAFRDEYETFQEAGAEVVGVSSDSVKTLRLFGEKYKLPFKLLSDADGTARKLLEVPKSFGILPGRVTYVIDHQGVIRHQFASQIMVHTHIEESLRVIQQIHSELV